VLEASLELELIVDVDWDIEGKVAFPSTLEASLACFHQCCILSSWGPLHNMIPIVWSLIAVRARNHLALRGGKS
jgi:hypothetical protein